jgi:hypothetical protein
MAKYVVGGGVDLLAGFEKLSAPLKTEVVRSYALFWCASCFTSKQKVFSEFSRGLTLLLWIQEPASMTEADAPPRLLPLGMVVTASGRHACAWQSGPVPSVGSGVRRMHGTTEWIDPVPTPVAVAAAAAEPVEPGAADDAAKVTPNEPSEKPSKPAKDKTPTKPKEKGKAKNGTVPVQDATSGQTDSPTDSQSNDEHDTRQEGPSVPTVPERTSGYVLLPLHKAGRT